MPVKWTVVYDSRTEVSTLARYDLVVLDGDDHPPLAELAAGGRRVLGYLSLGEVAGYRSYYDAVEAQGLLLGANPSWPDARFVDLRDGRWRARVLDELIPALTAQGFDGLFLDTLDDAAYLESLDPVRHAGMTEAAAALVQAIRARYPGLTLMMNRGYELLPHVGGSIDAVLAECLRGDWSADAGGYARVPAAEVSAQLAALRRARRANPGLEVFSLDYWRPGDADGVARLYAEAEADGFSPYVATLALDRVVRRPGDRAGDIVAAARNLGRLEGGRVVADRAGGGDVDWYKFRLTRDTRLALATGAVTADLDMELFAPGTERLTSAGGAAVRGEGSVAVLRAGTYRVRISGPGRASGYVLSFAGLPVDLSGADSLRGGSGSDLLNGGAGRDVLTGGGGADRFRFDSAAEAGDTITDFRRAQGDKLVLDSAGFGGVTRLTAENFRAAAGATRATTAAQRFVFDLSQGVLRYDADGRGGAAATIVARLDRPSLLASDVLFSG